MTDILLTKTLGVNNDKMLRNVTTKQIPLFLLNLTVRVGNTTINSVRSVSQFTSLVLNKTRNV